ncbi:MAG: hypothetical protein IPI42_07785 [Saprospiraceae bacterium]|nr:hypothetical protein [Candidatus Parvibacillus calidus]
MKYILNLLFLFPWALFAQEDPEALVLRGVALYDQGKIPRSIEGIGAGPRYLAKIIDYSL